MDDLHTAERALSELSMRLHMLAGACEDEVIAHRLRVIADALSAEAQQLRDLWASGFGPLL